MKEYFHIRDFFEYFDRDDPYHLSSLSELQEAIEKADPTILSVEASWFRTWSQAGRK